MAIKQFKIFKDLTNITTVTSTGSVNIDNTTGTSVIRALSNSNASWNTCGWYDSRSAIQFNNGDMIYARVRVVENDAANSSMIFGISHNVTPLSNLTSNTLNIWSTGNSFDLYQNANGNISFSRTVNTFYDFRIRKISSSSVDVSYKLSTSQIWTPWSTNPFAHDWSNTSILFSATFLEKVNVTHFDCASYYMTDSSGPDPYILNSGSSSLILEMFGI